MLLRWPDLTLPAMTVRSPHTCCPERRLRQQLKSLGLAGVVAYGLFNTIYYTVAFLFIWIYVAKVPSGEGTPRAEQHPGGTLRCNSLPAARPPTTLLPHAAPLPAGIGPTAAAKAFVQVMGLTWAGSQVTKVRSRANPGGGRHCWAASIERMRALMKRLGSNGAVAACRKMMGVVYKHPCTADWLQAPRAAGALLLAPAVDRGLAILEERLKLRSRQQVG